MPVQETTQILNSLQEDKGEISSLFPTHNNLKAIWTTAR